MRVLIGRDTRESGVWIERSCARRLAGEGAEVTSAGVLPTPAIAYFAKHRRFVARRRDLGVAQPVRGQRHQGVLGRGAQVHRRDASVRSSSDRRRAGTSTERAATASPKISSGAYLRISRDMLPDRGRSQRRATRASIAPTARRRSWRRLFESLGFDVTLIGVNPTAGTSTARRIDPPARMARDVVTRVELGGGVRRRWRPRDLRERMRPRRRRRRRHADVREAAEAEGRLSRRHGRRHRDEQHRAGDRARDAGIALRRTQVGDKYVMEELLRGGISLGGEQSGHVIFARLPLHR